VSLGASCLLRVADCSLDVAASSGPEATGLGGPTVEALAAARAPVDAASSASRRTSHGVVGSASPGRGQGSPRVTLRPAPRQGVFGAPEQLLVDVRIANCPHAWGLGS
jgi:hypothetical protein